MGQLTLVGTDPDTISTGSGPAPQSLVKLRQYQSIRADEGFSLISSGSSPLLEMATGTGKTATAADIIRQLLFASSTKHRILWIVHRIELVHQAADAIRKATGIVPGFELPGTFSTSANQIVVASKDSVRTFGRLARMQCDEPFTVIFTDEAHHSPGKSYQVVYDAWPKAVRFGMTATADRMDRKELSNYDARISPYSILDGINDAWLVPFRAKRVRVKSVDLSGVGLVAGDLNQGQLDAVIRSEESLHGIAHGLLSHAEGPTVVFATGVDSGQRLCEILCRYKPKSARFIDGTTDAQVRAKAFKDFGKGYQFLVNVGIATEGTDLPAAQTIAMVRSTKSRALFCQMLGRGGRPLPGLDLIDDDPVIRQGWIQRSAKPYCLVLDFVGNAGKHSIVNVADVIGYGSNRVITKVGSQIEAGDNTIDVYQALKTEQARETAAQERKQKEQEKERAERAKILATVTVEAKEQALIGLGGVAQEDEQVLGLDEPASPGQVESMHRLGVTVPPGCDRRKARFLISAARANLNLATEKQIDLLRKWGKPISDVMTKAEAGRVIGLQLKKFKGGFAYGRKRRFWEPRSADANPVSRTGTGSGGTET